MTELTEDALLDGRLRLTQPRDGYRVAIDPVLLAAGVPAGAGERVLDAGAGTGAASLCLATRVPDCQIVALEVERNLQRLASYNVSANRLGPQIDVMTGDLGQPPPRLVSASFDHVMTNPPYLEAAAATPPQAPDRARAHVESGLDLAEWLAACVRMLKQGGRLTLIHRADRLDAIMSALMGKVGEIVIFPFWPQAGRPARRLLVQGRKGARGPLRLAPGLVLHEADGRYSQAAEALLRGAAGLAPLAGPDHG